MIYKLYKCNNVRRSRQELGPAASYSEQFSCVELPTKSDVKKMIVQEIVPWCIPLVPQDKPILPVAEVISSVIDSIFKVWDASILLSDKEKSVKFPPNIQFPNLFYRIGELLRVKVDRGGVIEAVIGPDTHYINTLEFYVSGWVADE